MLEQLLIFTRGGLILWTCKELGNALKGSPIDTLIRSCLLEERSGAAFYDYTAPGAAYTLKWTFHNELGLVFVAVYQKILHLLYVDELLSMVKHQFSQVYDPKKTTVYNGFDETFRQLREEAEARAEGLRKSKKQVGKPVSNGRKQGQLQKGGLGGEKKNNEGGDGDSVKGGKLENGIYNGGHVVVRESNVGGTANRKENASSNLGAFDVNKLKSRSKVGKKTEKTTTLDSKGSKAELKKKKTKKNRVWDVSPKEAPESKLDFTGAVGENAENNVEVVAADHGESMMDREEDYSSESEAEEEEEAGKESKPDSKKKSWFSSMFQSIAGKGNLERSDLEPALKALKDRLMTKNVAEEIAEKLCESVAASLEGKKLGSFTRISSTVQAAMEEALVRILTPRRSIDILRDVHAAKEQRKPYVVVFVGAALSMVYISGAPVMFVGCGQSYTDLKKLNVKSIVKTLLK